MRVGTTWNWRLVVQHLHKDEIAKIMATCGLTSQDPGWLQQYHKAVNQVIKSQGGEEKIAEMYGVMAKEWNERELPQEMKEQ